MTSPVQGTSDAVLEAVVITPQRRGVAELSARILRKAD